MHSEAVSSAGLEQQQWICGNLFMLKGWEEEEEEWEERESEKQKQRDEMTPNLTSHMFYIHNYSLEVVWYYMDR